MDKNDSHTVCRYDHMTNFAVLVLYYDEFDPVCIGDTEFLCFCKNCDTFLKNHSVTFNRLK